MIVEEDNSYQEPSYNAEDQSESYEPTYYQQSKSANEIIVEQKNTVNNQSDTESYHEQTFDQNLGQPVEHIEDEGFGTHDELEEEPQPQVVDDAEMHESQDELEQ